MSTTAGSFTQILKKIQKNCVAQKRINQAVSIRGTAARKACAFTDQSTRVENEAKMITATYVGLDLEDLRRYRLVAQLYLLHVASLLAVESALVEAAQTAYTNVSTKHRHGTLRCTEVAGPVTSIPYQ